MGLITSDEEATFLLLTVLEPAGGETIGAVNGTSKFSGMDAPIVFVYTVDMEKRDRSSGGDSTLMFIPIDGGREKRPDCFTSGRQCGGMLSCLGGDPSP